MKHCYKGFNFRRNTLGIIDKANEVITEFKADGYDLTLRQLYYQFIAHDLFPEDRRWSLDGQKVGKRPKRN